MENPRSMSPGSLMPSYSWLLTDNLELENTPSKISVMRSLGVPYPKGYENVAIAEARKQAEQIALDLQKAGAPADPNTEIVAIIAYLQRLGTDIKVKNKTAVK